MVFHAKWICEPKDMQDVCPVFKRSWTSSKRTVKAVLYLTALGVYEARINGKRVGDYVLAPGWTTYQKRLQYQRYDVTKLFTYETPEQENELTVTVGKGWFSSPMPAMWDSEDKDRRISQPRGIFGELHLEMEDGTEQIIPTDSSWLCGESKVRFSEIYDGEVYDAAFVTELWDNAKEFDWPTHILIPQEGEVIREQERVMAQSIIQTPAGETVVDFGQEVAGYIEFTVDAKKGEKIKILHGEVLDRNGNFYNDNYRGAKAEIEYICREGKQTWHPMLTFFGFRYVKLVQFPGEVKPEQFCAIAVYSAIKRTGCLRCSNPEVNQLFSNIFWSQRGNFLDVPTDCPQRGERLGWTGDAQVFVKTAGYNYDVERFFRKWLRDLAAEQREDGSVGWMIPNYHPTGMPSAAWGDAAVICPWQIYLTYGSKEVLQEQYSSMKNWVDYITATTTTPYLWTGGTHFGDWLALDAAAGSFKGATRDDFVAAAYYAYSTQLVMKAGKVMGRTEDAKRYQKLYENIVKEFRKTYRKFHTQTEHVLAVYFGLAEDLQRTADDLAEMIRQDGCQIRTGFVGTPYILHVLSDYGHVELAYTLFLRKQYPSWLYSVGKGATTIWEHWDGIMENGDFWSTNMNSFNHYAYGSVADWVYEKAAGIRLLEEAPGFQKVKLQPMPDARLEWLEASINTRNGKVFSRWMHVGERIRYEISVEMPAEIVVGEQVISAMPGRYVLWS